MFESPQCNRPFSAVPLIISWGSLDWLRLPLLLALLLAIVAGLSWLGWRKRHRAARLSWLMGLTVIILIGLSISDRVLTLGLPSDPGTPVEAIVILGRGPGWQAARVDAAARLWRAKRAPLIFSSGINDTPQMLAQIAAKGIPPTALDGENCSLTTPQNALFSSAVLQPQGIRQILLVTDGPHMWRSLLDFQSQGFRVVPHVAPLPALPWIDKTLLSLRETIFLVTSGLHELWFRTRINDWNDPALTTLVQQARNYGEQQQKPRG
ncbi:YdcF family protein [Leptolyngbya sp. NK1-12]|uniref:YdcF family protein n=1 Tax=Leptolyngbya sp. NK1-12 TaxID=2547451 RepID=A0AA97AKJ0_9CYAN|nr:YdcF family protein [Leptolyngbya sp. NK1-12]WNZ26176.1 YdcF family protein [Leptolyngbya sp. NK1-12]